MKDRLDKIDDKIFEMNIGIKRIDESVKRINTMLEELIAALHNYDDGLEMFDDEPKRIPPCIGHEIESWNEEEGNKRMDIIGQNGNEGMHYTDVDNKGEYDDYGQRVVKDRDNDIQDNKHVGEDKGRYKNKYYRQPNTPVTPKQMSVVKHEQYRRPHKH